MEKVSNLIARRLNELGVETVFMVTGGGAMHLNDSFSHRDGMRVVYCHHEQACAIAAEGAYRATGKVACVNVTTGPGGLNALNGVLGQWTDSIPAIYVSGQVKFETTIGSCPEIGLRQLGDQEVDIVSVVKPIVKYAVQVRDPNEIGRELEKAFDIATTGRMGPVWIDVPMNVQGALVDSDGIPRYESERGGAEDTGQAENLVRDAWAKLASARRPLLVLGHGIRLSGAMEEMRRMLAAMRIPIVTTFNGFDLVDEDHPSFVGRVGTLGTRAGNFALQNADVVLELGSRNNIRQASYNWKNFAQRAYRIIVDIDRAELSKPTVTPNMAIAMDAKEFIAAMRDCMGDKVLERLDWLEWCRARRVRYPVVGPEQRDDSTGINPYAFFDVFTRGLRRGSVAVAGNGTACVCLFQAGVVGEGTRYFWNSGCASMGYDLPAALGAAVASRAPVFCFAGDGSLQMNIQELQTLVTNKLPVKLLYLNNDGYISIKQTQDNFFGRRAGCDPASGVETPRMEEIARAYGITYRGVRILAECADLPRDLLSTPGPAIAEIFLQSDYIFMPKLSSERLPDGRMVSKPLEDLFPFLERREFEANMITDKGESNE